MDNHLGYDRYERSGESNYRNGTKSKTVRSKYGEFKVDVPQDRQSSFEPEVLPKRQKDISSIDDKIISMYAKRNDHTANFRNDRGYLWFRNK